MALRYGDLGEAGGSLFWSDDLDFVEAYYTLTVQKATHGHTVDALAISQGWSFAVNDALHGHASDFISYLPNNPMLTVNDSTHGLESDNIIISNSLLLNPENTLHKWNTLPFRIYLSGSMILDQGYHRHRTNNIIVIYGATTAYRILVTWTDPTTWGPDDNPYYELRYRIDEDDSYVYTISYLPTPSADFIINLRAEQTLEASVRTVNDGLSTLWTNWQVILFGSASILEPNDTRHDHHVDENFSIYQANRLALADTIHANSSDSFNLTQANRLATNNSKHLQTSNIVSLTQANRLVTFDGLHAHTVDSVALTEISLLTLGTRHNHSADIFILTQANQLSIFNALHNHKSEHNELSTIDNLGVQRAVHAHTADAVLLTQLSQLVLENTKHNHGVDSALLTQQNLLALFNSSHDHTVDSIVLLIQNAIPVSNSRHLHKATNIVLLQSYGLIVTDTLHNHISDTPTLLLPGFLEISDCYNIHYSEHIDLLRQQNLLIIANNKNYVRSSRPTLSQAGRLTVADTLHQSSVDDLGLLQVGLNLSYTIHNHFADSFDLGDAYSVIVRDAVHGHFADSPLVSPYYFIEIDSVLHALISDHLTLGGQIVFSPNQNRIFLVTGTERIFSVSPGDRLFVLQ